MDRKTLLLLAILARASAGPLNVRVFGDENKCASTCTETNTFKYQTGTTYEFNYEANTVTTLVGASEEESGLQIKATADVEVLDKCEFSLKLRGVRLFETDPSNVERRFQSTGSEEFRRMLESETLRFSFQDGKVAEVCPTLSEDWRALNIKRGILSAFQNSMDSLTENKKVTETDVAGNCEAEYKMTQNSWGTIVVSKNKNILGCTDRHGHVTGFQATPYRVPSSIQSMPLMKSTHTCEQTFKKSLLHKATCQESHTFRPFSYGSSGATTTTSQSLEYSTYRNGITTQQTSIGRRTDLLFEHQYEAESQNTDRSSVISQLQEICETTKEDIRPEVPRMFSNLIYKMRRLDTTTLRSVWRTVSDDRRPMCGENTKTVRKYFMDAVPMCGTTASVAMIRQLISSDDVPNLMALHWLNSLQFISKPNKDMLREIKPLLEVARPIPKAMLSISTLVHSYCLVNPECSEEREVQDIVKIFEDNLGYDCKISTKEEREKVLMSLKAIGNTGIFTKAVDTLNRCISDKNKATDVRVAAIQAFRRMPCTTYNTKLMELFKNVEEDTELRVHAYLALMRCATRDVITEVKTTLETEKSTQVGSFVWTHLTNLMETSDPFKQDIREVLEDETLKKEFNNDVRKFSRNYEKSFFSELLNTGAKVESNLIWSQESYVPRSAMFNLTVDLFGQSVNLLEVDGRLEGMEYLMESFFGPNGYFQQNELRDMLIRKKRNVVRDSDIQNLHSKFDAKMDDETKGSVSVKALGNEILFKEFQGFDPLKNKDSFNPLDLLIKLAADHEIDYSKSVMFLDSSLIIPTAIGLPLNLTVNGTASVNIKVGGHLDIRKLMTSPHGVDIDGHIKPSGAVEISSMMTVDAFVARTGLKMVTTLHSSTFVDGKVTLKDGEFNFNMNAPKDKMEIVDVESKFFIIHQEVEREQKMITDNQVVKKLCSGDPMKMGLELCGELQVPNAFSKSGAPFYPFTGPTKFSVILHKRDTLTAYNFQAKYQANKERKDGETEVNHVARLAFDTPGSRIDRKMSMDFQMNTGSKSVSLEMVSPWNKKLSANGAITSLDDLKRLTARMMIDEKNEYSLSAEVQTSKRKYLYSYTPNVELRMPGREPITLRGTVEYQYRKKYSADLTLEKMFRHPVTVKTNVDTSLSDNRNRIEASVELRNQLFDASFSSLVDQKQNKVLSTRVQMEYNMDGRPKQKFVFSKKIRNQSSGNTQSYTMDSLITSDAYPDWNNQIALKMEKNNRDAEFSVDLRYGDNFDDENKKVYVSHKGSIRGRYPKATVTSENKLQVPAKDIDASLDLNHVSDGYYNQDVTVNGKWGKETGKVTLKTNDESTRGAMKYSANGMVVMPRYRYNFDTSLEQAGLSYTHQLTMQCPKGRYSMQTTYTNPAEKKHEFSSTVSTPGERDIVVRGSTQLEQMNFAVSGSADIRGEQYSAETKYVYQPRHVEASVDLIHPVRRVKADAELNGELKNGRGLMSVSWDADKDPRKKLTIQGNFEDTSNDKTWQKRGELSMSHPQHRAAVSVNIDSSSESTVSGTWNRHKITGTGKMNIKRYISGNVLVEGGFGLTSTIKNLEQLSLNFKHKNKGDAYNSGADFSWAEGKKLGGDLELIYPDNKNIKSRLTVSTPFTDFNTISMNWDHEFDDKNIKAHAQAMTDRKNFEVTVAGTDKSQPSRPSYEGTIGFKTPFQYLEDISMSVAHKHDSQQIDSSLTASIAPRKTLSFSIKGQDRSRTGRNLQGSVELKTPWDPVRDVSASLSHNDDASTQLTTILTAQLEPSQKYEVNVNGQNRGDSRQRDGDVSITVKTPIRGYRQLSLTASHKDDTRKFESNIGCTYMDGKRLSGKMTSTHYSRSWTSVSNTGNLEITTPFPNFETLGYSWNHRNTGSSLNSEATISWPADKIQFSVSGNHRLDRARRTISSSASLTTPFEPVQDVGFNIDHNHGSRDFTSKVNVRLDQGQSIIMEANLDNAADPKDLQGKFSLKAPNMDDITSEIKVETSKQPMTGHMEFNWARNQKMSLDSSLATDRKYEGSLRFTSPFTNFERMMISASHEKNLDTWETSSTVQYAPSKKIEMSSKVNINGKVLINTEFKFPCPVVQTVTFNLDHTASNIVNFATNVEFESLPKIRKITGEVSLNAERDVDAKLTVTTPFRGYENYGASLTHQNRRGRWITKSNIDWPSRQSVRLDSDLNLSSVTDFTGTITVTTPFRYLERTKLNFNHNGDLSDLKTHVDTEYNRGNKMAADVEFKNDRETTGTIKLATPFRDYESSQLTFGHSGSRDNFRSNAELAYGRYKKISTNLSFLGRDIRRIEVTFGLKTPFENVEDISFSGKHNGDSRRFNCAYEVNFAPGNKIELTTKFDRTRDITGEFSYKAPFYNDIDASFKHSGELRNFNTHAEATYAYKKIATDVSFSMIGDIEGSFRFTSPYDKLEDINASFKHSGEMKNFNSEAQVTYAPRKTIKGDVTFNMLKDIEGTASLTTPMYDDMSASFKHSGEVTNFNTHAETTYARGKKIESDVTFSWDDNMSGSLSFKSPFENFEEISSSFDHRGDLTNFRTKANVQYSPRDKMDIDVIFKNYRRITGSVTVRTPFDRFRRQSSSFTYTTGKVEADVVYDKNQKIEATVTYPSMSNVTVAVKTPYPEFEEIGAAYKYTQFLNGHMEVTYKTGKKIEADLEHVFQKFWSTQTGKLECSFSVKTPFTNYEEMSAAISMEGHQLEFTGHAEVGYPRNKKIYFDFNTKLSNPESKLILITLKTPYRNWELTEFSENITGTYKNFEKNTEFTMWGKKISDRITFKMSDYGTDYNIDATYLHRNPYAGSDITANLKYSGYPRDFTNHFDLSYKPGEMIENDITFSLKNGVQAMASLKTPFRYYEDMSVNINHKGNSWRSIASSAVVKYTPRDTISASTTFSFAPTRVMGHVDFSSPFRNFESISADLSHNGDTSYFKSNANVNYARGKQIKLEGEWENRDRMQSTITLTTPFENFENIEVTIKNKQNGPDYISNGILTWAPGKSINIDTEYKNVGDFFGRKDFKLYFTGSNTHRRDLSMKLKMDHSHIWKRSVETNFNTEFNGETMFDMGGNYRNARNTHSGTIEMKTPYPVKTEYSIGVDDKHITGDVNLNWDTKSRDSNVRFNLDTNNQGNDIRVKRDTTFKVITPRRTVIIEHGIDFYARLLKHSIVFCWDNARDKKIGHEFSWISRSNVRQEMSSKLSTPWRSLASTFSHEGSAAELNILWDADRNAEKKLTILGKHERSGNQIKQELVIKHPNLRPDITIQNEVNIGDANTIYSSNTEIDYSGDRRKKLTVSTNIRKESVRFSGTNYTMQFDISHPASSLEFSAKTQLGNSERFWSAGFGMDYRTAKTREVKAMLLRTQINKLRNEMELELLSPVVNMNSWGRMRDMSNRRYSIYHFELKNTYNFDRVVTSSMDIDTRERNFDLKVNYDPANPGNMLHAYGKCESKTLCKAEVYRMHNNRHITEALVSTNLNNTNLLHSRIHLRPSLNGDIVRSFISIPYEGMPTSKPQTHGTVYDDMADEMSNRWRRTAYMYKTEMGKIIKSLNLDEDNESMQRDMDTMNRELTDMYRRNEFFMKDTYETMEAVADKISRKVDEMYYKIEVMRREWEAKYAAYMQQVEQKWAEYRQQFEDQMVELRAKYEQKVAEYKQIYEQKKEELKEKLAVCIEKAIVKISDVMEPIVLKYVEYYNLAEEKLAKLKEHLNEKYEELINRMKAHPRYQQLKDKYAGVMQKIDDLRNHDYVSALPTMPEMDWDSMNAARDYIGDMAAHYTGAIYDVRDKMNTNVQQLLGRDEVQLMKQYANSAIEQGKQYYSDYEVEKHAKAMYEHSYNQAKDWLKNNYNLLTKKYLRFDDTRFTVWDPEHGEIQFEVGLPISWESFEELPKFEEVEAKYRRMVKNLKLYSPGEFDQNKVLDVFYKYKPSRDIRNWVPPFKAMATISGNQHFTTFDNRHFEFAGTCSYVLAHDFIDGNFTVLVNFDEKQGKSLVVMVNDKEIQIKPDFTVLLDGKKIDLPVEFGNTTMMRIGNAVRVHNTNGVTVTCDNVHDICTTNMTGWYFGKTAGLFGTYDNEPNNDFLTAERQNTDDVTDFTRSWSVRCRRHRNNANIVTPDETSRAYKTCAALFMDEASPMRPCFKIVEPKPYFDMCNNELSNTKNRVKDDTASCNVAADYVQKCKSSDVYVRIPRTCVTCETGDKKNKVVNEGEEFEISSKTVPAPKSADVVFVIEEKSCNKKAAKRLPDIVKNIEDSLRKQGMKNNRFGIVGFGGVGVHNFEHSHTMDGQLFNNFRLFKLGSEGLDFSGDGSNNDVLRAVRMAVLYPSRAGVAKIIIVVPCSACDEVAVTYSEIQQLLMDYNTQMHIVLDSDFTVKGKKSYNYYGLDADRVYTNKDNKKFNGDTSLRKHIGVPKDLCVALAHETNGSVFNLNVLTKTRANIQKKFVTVLGQRVAKTAAPAPCQMCQCVADELGVGKSVCRSCEVPSFTSYFQEIMSSKDGFDAFGGDDDTVDDKAKKFSIKLENINKKAKRVRTKA